LGKRGNCRDRPKDEGKEEATTLSEMSKEELIAEAKNKGIKDADVLNQDELLEVLRADITKKEINAIVKKAKKR